MIQVSYLWKEKGKDVFKEGTNVIRNGDSNSVLLFSKERIQLQQRLCKHRAIRSLLVKKVHFKIRREDDPRDESNLLTQCEGFYFVGRIVSHFSVFFLVASMPHSLL